MSKRGDLPAGPPAFRHPTSVRFSDTDAMGHVNNARFLTYLEDARIALFRRFLEQGVSIIESGAIIARIEIDYVRPLLLRPEPVTVSVWVTAVGRSSFTLTYTIEQDGAVAARAVSVVVSYDYAAEAPRPLDDVQRGALEAFLPSNGSSTGEIAR